MSAKKEESKDIVVGSTAAALPSFLSDVSDVAGLGNSQESSDSSLPFVGLLQQMSPEINESSPLYMEDAKSGFIASKGLGKFWPARLDKSEDGLIVVPCGFQRNFVEWKPNRGGYVETHPFDPDAMKKLGAKQTTVKIDGKDRTIVALPSGNQIVDTMYTFLLATDGTPMILGAASTAQGPMRNWMTYRKNLRHPTSGAQLPSFAKIYRLRAAQQTKDNNTWWNWKVDDAGWNTEQWLYEAAKKFAQDIAAGEVQIGRPDMFDEEPTPDVPI